MHVHQNFARVGRFLMAFVLSTEYGVLNSCDAAAGPDIASRLELSWANDYLFIRGRELAGGEVRVHYLEAYCRDGSTDRAWEDTVIGHHTKLIEAARDGGRPQLQCKLNDGVMVDHAISTRRIDDKTEAVDFHLTATNP